MRYYPLLLDLRRTNIAIIGAGRVGRRKLFSLLPCGPASIVLFDPALHNDIIRDIREEMEEAAPLNGAGPAPAVAFYARSLAPSDLDGIGLLFAATNNRQINEEAGRLCRDKGIWCNIADAEDESNFIVPAAIRREGLTVAVATNGQSPALTRKIKSDIEQWLGTRYSSLSTLMGRLRPMVLALEAPSEDNTRIFRSLVDSPLADYLNGGDKAAAAEVLRLLLPPALHDVVGDLLHDL